MENKNLKFSEYPFEIPEEKETIATLQKLVDEVKACDSFSSAKIAIEKYNKFMEDLFTSMSVASVRYSLDTTNQKYKEAQDVIDEISPQISNYSTKFEKILVNASYRKDLEKEYGSYLLTMYENNLKSFDEKIIPELIEENKLTSKYDEILGGAQIKFNDNIYNLSQMSKFLCDKERDVRKAAAIAVDNWWAEHEKEVGEIYDQLVHLRTNMAKKLGFKNFVDLGYLRLGRTDYNSKMVAGYRKQIQEVVVPICTKLYANQIKELGIENPQFYDYNLKCKNGNPTPVGNKDVLVNAASKMYNSLSEESKEFFNFMMDHELMDLEARPGKQPGGYCTYFPTYKAPFIFSNFNGTDGDVNVLTHEGGHAFQAYLSRDIKISEYQNPTLEACEIHSMSMEFFAWPYMKEFFGNDSEKYCYTHLADAIEFLPYGITIDEFQHWVYENPDATHEERCAKYREIEKKNLPHLKFDECPIWNKGGRWLRQSHVFGTPFYYIDYTLAQVVAFEFLSEDIEDHNKAWEKYVELCKLGGKLPFTGLLKEANLRNPFVEGTVKKNITPLIKVLDSFDTSNF